jgi:hypothetical protein
MTERTLDLFKTLDGINKKKRFAFRELSAAEQKEFAPLVIMRWLSGTNNPGQITFLNEVVNPFVFDLSKHKELLYVLMTVCTNGSFKKYSWQKAKGKSIPSMPGSLDVIKRNDPYLSHRQAMDLLKIFKETDILGMAEDLGCEKEELTKIKAEFKKLK